MHTNLSFSASNSFMKNSQNQEENSLLQYMFITTLFHSSTRGSFGDTNVHEQSEKDQYINIFFSFFKMKLTRLDVDQNNL